MTKFLKIILKVVLHLLAVCLLLFLFYPMAKWYFDAKPVWGVDFFYTTTIVNLIKNNLAFPPAGWNYIWFSGSPILSSFPALQYYLILPFTFFLDLVSAVKIWMLVSFAFYFLGLYACFFRLCKNIIISVILAIAAIYSVGVYGTLMWGGSLPSHATQAFYPWVVFFIITHLQNTSHLTGRSWSKYLLSASLLGGLSILAHPQIFVAYIAPTVSIITFFSFGSLNFFRRIKSLVIFFVISLIIALPLLVFNLGASFFNNIVITDSFNVAISTLKTDYKTMSDIAGFNRAQPLRLYTDTNQAIFIILAICFVFYLIRLLYKHNVKTFFSVLPFTVLAIYYVFYVWLFSVGISIYHGGWYRLFWSTPFWLGLLASIFWGEGEKIFHEKLNAKWKIFAILPTVVISILSVPLIINFSRGIKDKIILRSNPSSAFPDVLSMRTGSSFSLLKKELVPNWLNSDDTNYRLYAGDQTINIWWNSLMKMPLVRGYFDAPMAKTQGYSFWIDASLSKDMKSDMDQLEASFKYPTEVAFNNTLFLLDWYSIKYVEAGPSPATITLLPLRLMEGTYLKNKETLDFNQERFSQANQILTYYEFKDDLITPILSATNAPTIGIFSSDTGYETVVRALADANLGSRKLIPIKLGSYLDNYDLADLKNFDSLFIYDYKYRNKTKAFKNILDYGQAGGKIFIDNGTEGFESQEANLPEIFPFTTSIRKPLGFDWGLIAGESPVVNGIDFQSFDPPIFDKAQWNFSYSSDSSLKSDAKVVLKNHNVPVMITRKVGKGEILWSGMNFPYHVTRFHNKEEIKFFVNIINFLIPTVDIPPSEPLYQTKFVSAQQRLVFLTGGAKGVLLREQNFPGWSATIKTTTYNLQPKIWSAGPTYPGFIYVSLPKEIKGDFQIDLKYHGSIKAWVVLFISLSLIIYLLETIVFGGFILGRGSKHLGLIVSKIIHKWWGRDDE